MWMPVPGCRRVVTVSISCSKDMVGTDLLSRQVSKHGRCGDSRLGRKVVEKC